MVDFLMSNLQGVLMGAALLSVGVAALFGFTRTGELEGDKILLYDKRKALRPVSVALMALLVSATVAFVPRGYVGVIYDWSGGIQQEERPEGLNFMIPFKQHVTNVDTRVKAWTFNDENVYVHTEDFHEIRVPFTINYRINPDEAAHVLQSVSGDPAETILSHAALNSVRTEVGSIVLDKLAQEVSSVAVAVEKEISPQAERNGLLVQFVAIEDTVVDGAYTQAVRDERISERNIRTAANNVKVAENEAQAVVERADGDAQAIERLAQARQDEQARLGLTPTEYVWYQNWDGVLPVTLLGTDAADLLLDVPNQ